MKQTKKDIIVLGAGFKGMMAAFKLAQLGLKELIEGSKLWRCLEQSCMRNVYYLDAIYSLIKARSYGRHIIYTW